MMLSMMLMAREATNVTKNRKLVYSLKAKAQYLQQAERIDTSFLNNDFNDDSYRYITTIDNVIFTSKLDIAKLKTLNHDSCISRPLAQQALIDNGF